jgi:type 1 glutamine amidotransferase
MHMAWTERWRAFFSGWLTLGAVTSVGMPAEAADVQPAYAALVFTKTAGYRHASIPAGIAAVEALGREYGFKVDASESASLFTDESLSRYRVVIFLNTTGDILDAGAQAAFERFIRRGGGFVGIHSASDTEYDWPWYGQLVGAYFRSHPAVQRATLLVDRSDPSTSHLPVQWLRKDEWYDFREDPGEGVNVLVRIDERTYSGGKMGARHPITWYHEFDGGRAWYTALGHTVESYAEPDLLQHLLGGIQWAAKADSR